MTSFIEERMPICHSFGTAGGPEFSTDVIEIDSGAERRNINWSDARGRWNIVQNTLNKSETEQMVAFFRSVKGRAIGFRFKDWTDYEAENQLIGVGDGVEDTFQLKKIYETLLASSERIITKPVQGTVLIYVNSVLQTETTDYTIDYATGEVVFEVGSVPADTHEVRADFEFDIPVRFDTDRIVASHDAYNDINISDLPIIELRV